MANGKSFKVTQVEEMLKNPVYAGFVTRKGETFPGKYEALIDLATWERLQEVQQQRSRRRTRPAVQHHPLLAGLGVCASCGAPLWHQPYKTGERYYQCATMGNLGSPPIEGVTCIRRKSDAEATEAAVLAWIGGLTLTPGLVDDAKCLLRESRAPAPVNRANVEQQRKRLARAYADGAFTDEEYTTQLAMLQIQQEHKPNNVSSVDVEEVLTLLENIPLLLQEARPSERRMLLGEMVSEVYIARREVYAFRPTKAAEPLFHCLEQRLDWRPMTDVILTSGVKMGRVGLEPTTVGLKGHCSTAELPAHT